MDPVTIDYHEFQLYQEVKAQLNKLNDQINNTGKLEMRQGDMAHIKIKVLLNQLNNYKKEDKKL